MASLDNRRGLEEREGGREGGLPSPQLHHEGPPVVGGEAFLPVIPHCLAVDHTLQYSILYSPPASTTIIPGYRAPPPWTAAPPRTQTGSSHTNLPG